MKKKTHFPISVLAFTLRNTQRCRQTDEQEKPKSVQVFISEWTLILLLTVPIMYPTLHKRNFNSYIDV